jgi:hypothetical protein
MIQTARDISRDFIESQAIINHQFNPTAYRPLLKL